ncbi:NAD(P)H-binding protein [Sansalvadorimonas sp. 2012CJ34-2]|uniref:NAD(P)H-binding protein n=1 Tax=Parendozoicomonas callyspongiae TaxID=2942213 RepID=A0ABT0PDF7_9GAMM|nr:NAD(P)H-binding protein [Sansalvadorimonas sp. 2012CJ34-2]MCL6269419.1 NAD(P)H-binding protein [Sansalvadorimonas sp. 2012CJ34-2]
MEQLECRTAVISGASGAVGRHLLQKLLACQSYSKIVSLVRKPSGIESSRLTELVVDFETLDQLGELEGLDAVEQIDDIYCCLGTTRKRAGSAQAFQRVDRDYVLKLARLGMRFNMQKFAVISSVGAGKGSSGLYLKTKTEMEQQLGELNIPQLLIFRPSLLHGERAEFRLGEAVGFYALQALKWLPPLMKYQPVLTSQVAKAMLSITLNSQNENVRIVESMEMQKV